MTQQEFSKVCAGMNVFNLQNLHLPSMLFQFLNVNPRLYTHNIYKYIQYAYNLINLSVVVITQDVDARPNLKESIHSATGLVSNGIIGEHDIGFPIIQTSGRSEYQIVTGLSLDC